MSVTGIAALIAAVSVAVLALTAAYLAVRFVRALGDTVSLVRETRARVDAMSAGLAELSGRVAALGSAGRAARPEARADEWTDERGARNEPRARRERVGSQRTAGPSEPWSIGERVNKAAAVAYGVRHAVLARRHGGRATLPGEIVDGPQTRRSVRDKKVAVPARSQGEAGP